MSVVTVVVVEKKEELENIVFKSAIETLPSHLIDARIPFNFQLPVQFHLLERGINTDTDLPLLCTTDPVDLIFNGLTIKRPKPKIKEKLLELGLATDRKDLRKKRSRKSNHGECVHSLSLSLSFPANLLFALSLFSGSLKRLWSTPCSGQSYPIPFASVFLTALPRLFPFDQSFLLTRLRPTACDWTRFLGGGDTWRELN